MTNTNVTNPQQLISVINALDTLKDYLIQQLNQPQQPVVQLSATTAEVNWITKGTYDWVLLRNWCRDNGVEIDKADYYGLMLNDYPAQAWLEVYGVDLATIFPTRLYS